MISPSSTNPKVTQIGDYIFRVCFLDAFQGTVMAQASRPTTLKLKKVAILKDVKNDYSVGLAKYFTERVHEAWAARSSASRRTARATQDFRAQLTAIKAQEPRGHLRARLLHRGRARSRARRASSGITVPLLGGDGWESDQLLEIGGDALNGCYYSNHFALDAARPQRCRSFVAELQGEVRHGARRDRRPRLRRRAASCSTSHASSSPTDDPDDVRRRSARRKARRRRRRSRPRARSCAT